MYKNTCDYIHSTGIKYGNTIESESMAMLKVTGESNQLTDELR
jgi:hypothetical protein